MTELMVVPVTPVAVQVREDSTDDAQVMGMWLHGRPSTTRKAYGFEIGKFLDYVSKPLRQITLGDLQDYIDTLAGLATASRARAINAIKSLFSFCQKTGYLDYNVAAAVHAPKVKNTLAERIISEAEMHRIINAENSTRNRILLRLLYASGGRVSEIAGLKWRDTQERENGTGQVTLFGKGEKTRVVLLSADTWKELMAIRGDAGINDPVFVSRKKQGHLTATQIFRIVKAAAGRAGITGAISPHWFRHAHASHSLDRGASLAVVRDTLGHSSIAITSRYVHARPNDSSGLYLAV